MPVDLSDYFREISDNAFSDQISAGVNLLAPNEVAEQTAQFREFHDVVSALQGVVLDDANTSNYHVYLMHPGCRGVVLFLSHDGDSRIVFPSLQSMLAAMREALATSGWIVDFHPTSGVVLEHQGELHRLIVDLLDERILCDASAVLLVLIPSLDLTDLSLLERLAKNDDFYIAEAVADAISHRPRQDLKPVAVICQKHSHPQAARAGARAVAAIRQLGS
ncbi:MAG: hypothetical protein CMJ58_14520 [Planctomycetaceae bacterium]|nr:hypothetical protein [Planctomycetaceae bacterium]